MYTYILYSIYRYYINIIISGCAQIINAVFWSNVSRKIVENNETNFTFTCGRQLKQLEDKLARRVDFLTIILKYLIDIRFFTVVHISVMVLNRCVANYRDIDVTRKKKLTLLWRYNL